MSFYTAWTHRQPKLRGSGDRNPRRSTCALSIPPCKACGAAFRAHYSRGAQLTPARNRPVTWAYWLNGIRTHCQSHIHTRGTLRHVHCGRGRRGQSSSHDENASRGGCECGMHRSSIKAVASRDWPVSRRVQKGGPEPMKRRTRDFRAWLVEAISCYDTSAELHGKT